MDFDVLGWMEAYRSGDGGSVRVDPPIETGACWTRESNLKGGKHRFGDRSGLLPYQPCQVPISLAEGFPEKYVKKQCDVSVTVDVILKALKAVNVPLSKFALVTFRNNLNKIANTVINHKQTWTIDACVLSDYPSTTFLDIHHTDTTEYPDSDLYCYYGYKFESVCTGSGQDAIVDSSSEFAMVVETQINDTKCAIAAEIDCYDPQKAASAEAADLTSLVELKTMRSIELTKQQINAQKFKYPKWWFQSSIVGVPQLVIGSWTGDGILVNTRSMITHEIPNHSLNGVTGYKRQQMWTPELVLGFLAAVLEWMQGLLKMDPDRQYRFTFRPDYRLIHSEICQQGDLIDRIRTVIDS